MRLSLGITIALLGMVVFVGSAPARAPLPDQTVALAGIKRAVSKGWIDRASAARYRNSVNRAASLIRRLPLSRRVPIASTLHQVAQVAERLTAPRASAVLGQLAVNNAYFAKKGPPTTHTDITDADGVVYRYMSGLGFEFHPLANFGALNAKAASGTTESVERLAQALIERGVKLPGGGISWEYYFNYSGGRAPWLSGMAQAVAAQAFANAAQSDQADAKKLMATARGAYRAIPGRLLTQRAAGPWIRLYSFNRLVVLNAQLQSTLSLQSYANASTDGDAAALATAMERAAASDLGQFDTGYWTYYSLPRNPAPLSYQTYVVQLLRKLAPEDPRFSAAATRVAAYATQPPAFKIANSSLGMIRFWLSKPATVGIKSAGQTKSLALDGGWYNLGWKLPQRAGAYAVLVNARDWAGNSASLAGLPFVRVVPAATWKVVGSGGSQTKSIEDAAEVGMVKQVAAATTTPAPSSTSFSVGAGLDTAAQASLALSTRLDSVRLSVPWSAASSVPDPATVEQLQNVPIAERLIVELTTDSLPTDSVGLSALTAFASSLVGQVPRISELLLGPAPTVANASEYSAALASLYDAVKPESPTLLVAGELNGAVSPKATLTALADALSVSGRTTPIMDELAFSPAPAVAKNEWTINDYARLETVLGSVFAGTAQSGSTLPILIDGVSVATTIPAQKTSVYLSTPGPVPGVSEEVQTSVYDQALQSAVCMPNVSGLLFSRLVDSAGSSDPTSDQSGLYYADSSPKTSENAVAQTAALAERGVLAICPGLQAGVAAKTLVFSLGFSRLSPPGVVLACTRDCVYLVTLTRSDGKPVSAKRGALRADAGPITVRLPISATLPAGSGYRLRVSLVAQVNPGPVREYRSPKITGS